MLTHEYVKPGSREFTLSAYGYIEGDTVGVTAPHLLFEGGRKVTAALGKAVSEESVALDFKAANVAGEDTGNTRMVVKIGKIGSLVMNVAMSDAIDF